MIIDAFTSPLFIISTLESHWLNVNNRREFFIELAKENDFDPFVAENWYKYSREEIRGHKKVCRITSNLSIMII